MKQKMLVAAMLVLVIGSGCSKTESTTEANSRATYVSEHEQYVDSLEKEISIDNPEALLDDLNQSAGDNAENAEQVRLKSIEQPVLDPEADPSAVTSSAATLATDKATKATEAVAE